MDFKKENQFSAHKYHTRNEFISDIELIANNCEQYNGNESNFTKQARLMVDFTKQALDEVNIKWPVLTPASTSDELSFQFGDHCAHLERNIALVQERAKNDADLDDTWVDDEREHEDLQRQVSESFCCCDPSRSFYLLRPIYSSPAETAHRTMILLM